MSRTGRKVAIITGGSQGIGASLVEFGGNGFPVVFRGLDFLFSRPGFEFGELRRHHVPPRAQLGSIQLRDWLPCFQRITFLGEKLFDTSAVTRGHANLVRLNRSGD